jgi:hypothetical protein
VLLGGFHHRYKALQAFADGAVDVLLREGFRRSSKYSNFFHACGQCIFKTFEVWGEGCVGDASFLLDLREHIGRTGHLRHPLGRDETADFHIAQACGSQVIDQTHLVGDADGLFLVLQTVAGADFDQADLFG